MFVEIRINAYDQFREGSSFMVGRALTSVFWGAVADRYGRKPVIVFGTFVVYVNLYSNVLFKTKLKYQQVYTFCFNCASGLFSILSLVLVLTFGWQLLHDFFSVS